MSDPPETGISVHLSGMDEFLADNFMRADCKPIKLAVEKNGDEGYLSAVLIPTEEAIDDEGIDFELSSCECGGLDSSRELSDFLKRPVYTSSAYDYFDFLLMHLDSFECLADFTGNAWKIKILKTGVK